jgi:hypothetical protein
VAQVFEFEHRTMSNKPRYRSKKEKAYVENELYSEQLTITNPGAASFPAEDVVLTVRTEYATQQANVWTLTIEKGSIAPRGKFTKQTDRKVLASGSALFKLDCHPYHGGVEFVDMKGQPILMDPTSFDSFHAVSTMELATLAGLYMAAVGTVLAAVGVILSAILH